MSARIMCTKVASTTRNKPEGGARFSGQQPYLDGIAITPLWSLNRAMIDLFGIDAPADMQQAYHVPMPNQPLPDIAPGDELVLDGIAHPISYVQKWESGDSTDIDSMVIIVKTNRGE